MPGLSRLVKGRRKEPVLNAINEKETKRQNYGQQRELDRRHQQLLRALIDPRTDQGNLILRERRNLVLIIRRWHPHIFVADVRDVVDQHAFGALASDDDLAILPSLQSGLERIQPQSGLLLFGTVTLDAGFLKKR